MFTFLVFFGLLLGLIFSTVLGSALVAAGLGEGETRFNKELTIASGVVLLAVSSGIVLFSLFSFAIVLGLGY